MLSSQFLSTLYLFIIYLQERNDKEYAMQRIPAKVKKILPASILNIPRVKPAPLRVAAGENQKAVDTYGWDTIFAIRIADVNKAIVDFKSSPREFDFIDEEAKLSCSGTFSDWSICEGGDGQNIRFALPISDIKGSYGTGDKAITFSYPKLTAIIQIKLRFIPHAGQPSDEKDGSFHDLVVRHTCDDPTDPVASLVEIKWESGDIKPSLAKYIVEGAITQWCNDNLAGFSHIFSTVNLNRYIDKGQWAFCNPSYVSYAYVDRGSPDTSILGVLCMTGGRSTSTNVQQVNPATIPSSSRAGFLVSRERFLKDLILPTIPLQWPHAKPGDFEVTSDNDYLNLKDGRSVQLPDVKHDGTNYTPYLKKFSIQIVAQTLQFDTYTEVEVSPGITAWCKSTHWYEIGIGKCKSGQTLVYKQHQDPVVEHGHMEAEGIKILEDILIVIGIIVLIILSILTDGAAFIVASLIAGIVIGMAAATPRIIELVNTDDAPSVDLLAFNISNPINWSNSQAFTLDYADLSLSLRLGGNPGFI